MTAEITSILTNERTEAQRAVLDAVAEVLVDMPEVRGFAVCLWDGEHYLTYSEPGDHSAAAVPNVVMKCVREFYLEEEE